MVYVKDKKVNMTIEVYPFFRYSCVPRLRIDRFDTEHPANIQTLMGVDGVFGLAGEFSSFYTPSSVLSAFQNVCCTLATISPSHSNGK